jgi:hypothetical protein
VDFVWVKASVLCEERVGGEIARAGGRWEGDGGDEKVVGEGKEGEEKQTVGALESLGNVSVLDGPVTHLLFAI